MLRHRGAEASLAGPAAKGEKLLAFSLTEPGSGSDTGAVSTVAEKKGDGWLLTGNKIYVSNGREA